MVFSAIHALHIILIQCSSNANQLLSCPGWFRASVFVSILKHTRSGPDDQNARFVCRWSGLTEFWSWPSAFCTSSSIQNNLYFMITSRTCRFHSTSEWQDKHSGLPVAFDTLEGEIMENSRTTRPSRWLGALGSVPSGVLPQAEGQGHLWRRCRPHRQRSTPLIFWWQW